MTVETQDKATRWAYAVLLQLDRLVEARDAAVEGTRRVRDKRRYDRAGAEPFYRLDADKHFALTAARNRLRALDALDGDDRLAGHLDRGDVELLRNALEHWDEPDGRAATTARARGVIPPSHVWQQDGPGVLGDLVDDGRLRAWATQVATDVVALDPFARS